MSVSPCREALELVAANVHLYSLCLIDAVLPDIDPPLLFSRISEIAVLAGPAQTNDARRLPLVLMASAEGMAVQVGPGLSASGLNHLLLHLFLLLLLLIPILSTSPS